MASVVATPTANGGDRRKSARAVQQPPNFSQEHHYGSVVESAKRKRPAATLDHDEARDEDDAESESEQDDEEDEPDEEELREKKQKQRRQQQQQIAKPAAKRSKTANGSNTTLAIRSANAPVKNVSKAAKKKARSRPSQIQATGLYADVFGKDLDAETAATSWHNKLEADHVAGITDMVNFILQTVGCEARVDDSDISDVDNVPARLGEILEQYVEQKEGDYPLSGKQKQYHGMKEVFVDFFRAVPRALHNSGLFYEEVAIYDNLHIWVATMSGAPYRSFRVTATLASLAMITGQTEIASELRSSIATTKSQLDAERKKKKSNTGRIDKLQDEMAREEQKLEVVDNQLKDAFDTVYVHRYRDVEERLRVECARAMGTWVQNYRHMFLEGQFLRYLGWVMSDPYAPTRLEVIRQLKAIYKMRSNLSALRSFTERFRARLVEMGAGDADLVVRTETIELLNMLRSAEMLEPDDIDTIGQLIFDSEAQIRKAVARFFVSNIQDLYSASIEDFDKEEFEAALPDVENIGDFDEPCKLWIKFKCLAQTLGSQTGDVDTAAHHKLDVSGIEHRDSRYMIATRSIFDVMPELSEWESLAGYLLFDHSTATAVSNPSDIASAVQEAYKVESGEELILLDVLFCAAKSYIVESQPDKSQQKSKMTNKEKEAVRQRQETAAHNLSALIPKLHNKYGSIPRGAKSVLRLNQLFNPDLIAETLEEEGEIEAMLDDVKKQFTSHNDTEVLAEASRALRAALSRESSRDAARRKIRELWNDLITFTMSPLLVGKKIEERGSLGINEVRQLADVIERLAQLASVQDCCEVVEGRFKWQTSRSTQRSSQTLMQILLMLVRRGELDDDTAEEIGEMDNQICTWAIKIILLHYRWKIVAVRKAIVDKDLSYLSTDMLTALAAQKNEFIEVLLPIITARKPLDGVRRTAILNMLDLHVLLATLRNAKVETEHADDETKANLENLVTEMSTATMTAVMDTHERMEKRLARKTNRKNVQLIIARAQKAKRRSSGLSTTPAPVNGHALEDDEVDRPPEDSDDEDAAGHAHDSDVEASSDDGDDMDLVVEDGLSTKDAKKKSALIAETSLCELTAKIVLALLARVVPRAQDVRARLQINRNKLGKSYMQVIAYADDKKEKTKKARSGIDPKTPVKSAGHGKGKPSVKKAAQLSEPLYLSDDDIEDPDEREARQEEGDPEALRDQGLEDDASIREDDVAEATNRKDKANDNDDDDDDEIMGD